MHRPIAGAAVLSVFAIEVSAPGGDLTNEFAA
jgi:hypothetical protein